MIHNSSPVPSNVEYLVHLGNKRFEDLLRTTLQYHLFMMRTITYGYYLFAYILLWMHGKSLFRLPHTFGSDLDDQLVPLHRIANCGTS